MDEIKTRTSKIMAKAAGSEARYKMTEAQVFLAESARQFDLIENFEAAKRIREIWCDLENLKTDIYGYCG